MYKRWLITREVITNVNLKINLKESIDGSGNL
nr:hypothetical protein CJLB15_00011 [Campylobacter phage CJLB-15]